VRARYPEHAAQVDEAARDLGVDNLVLTLGQLSYDLTLSQYACSTIALATPDGPVAARNMDWCPADLIARASCVVPGGNGILAGWHDPTTSASAWSAVRGGLGSCPPSRVSRSCWDC